MKTQLLVILTLTITACGSKKQPGQEQSVQEIKTAPGISNAHIIRSPVSAQLPEDTTNVAKMTFSASTYDFGEVSEGTIVEHSFHFINTGKKPLLISNARSTCGCTVPQWPRDPVMPGESAVIEVKFNTSNKTAEQVKPVTITANTYPARNTVYLKGKVVTALQ